MIHVEHFGDQGLLRSHPVGRMTRSSEKFRVLNFGEVEF
jgi:hypothetical protein